MEKVLRVATFNNFNFSNEEFNQLKGIEDKYSEFSIFVNSNPYPTIRGKYPCVICINPTLDKFVRPKGEVELIRAVRVKYVADAKPLVKKAFNECLGWAYRHDIPILLTYMRFRKLATLRQFTNNGNGYYSWQKNYYRQLVRKTFDLDLFHYCDINEKGCPSCLNCARLPFGFQKADIFSINLSSSGVCAYACPDCYVKNWQNCWHNGKLCFDKIMQNTKLAGHESYQKGYGGEQITFEEFMKKEAKPLIEVGL